MLFDDVVNDIVNFAAANDARLSKPNILQPTIALV
jgi:hypothetical protein